VKTNRTRIAPSGISPTGRIEGLAIMTGCLVTACEDGSVPLNSKVLAEFKQGESPEPMVARLICAAPALVELAEFIARQSCLCASIHELHLEPGGKCQTCRARAILEGMR